MNSTERTTLYYREGSSDKVYQASLEPAGNLFVVNFAYGRRGRTLNTGTKTTPGRPASGGTQLKYKFVATLSAQVTNVNSGRSVGLALVGPAGWRSCGNVTIPVNHPMPQPGHVVEVRYLNAFPESGALFQPVYLGVRSDLDLSASTADQLKFKAADEIEP